ncbi:MAG TPA: hypothetical protein DCQ97_01480 [Chitinophagaceae bacterium]|nr:hypothetical protein [Chitinophagaceae bacterium]
MKKRITLMLSAAFFFTAYVNAQTKDTLACPVITLTGPVKYVVNEGKPAVISVKPFGKAYEKYRLTYNWSVSTGTIISGQGTPVIKVDTRGLKGQSITAGVEINGLRYDCTNFSSITIDVVGKN